MKKIKAILISFFLFQSLSMMLAETQEEFQSRLLDFIRKAPPEGIEGYNYAKELRGRWKLVLDLVNKDQELLYKFFASEIEPYDNESDAVFCKLLDMRLEKAADPKRQAFNLWNNLGQMTGSKASINLLEKWKALVYDEKGRFKFKGSEAFFSCMQNKYRMYEEIEKDLDSFSPELWTVKGITFNAKFVWSDSLGYLNAMQTLKTIDLDVKYCLQQINTIGGKVSMDFFDTLGNGGRIRHDYVFFYENKPKYILFVEDLTQYLDYTYIGMIRYDKNEKPVGITISQIRPFDTPFARFLTEKFYDVQGNRIYTE